MRIVFLGSDPIARPLLEWIIANPENVGTLAAVFTQPDRPVGRGQHIVANEIKTCALAYRVPVLQPEKLTDDVRHQLAELRPDVSVVMAYGHILRDAFIATPRLGTLNLHASLLPKFRGASPIQTAIASGERETGISLMRIVRKLDAGPVADVERVTIESRDTAADLEAKLSRACVPLLERNWASLRAGTLNFAEQDGPSATYCRRLTKADSAIDFNASAESLAARINGLYPWPGCTVEIGTQIIKIGLAEAETDVETKTDTETVAKTGEPASPGTVISTSGESVRVATSRGILKLRKLQRPGGKMLAAADFMRGFALPVGTVIPSRPMNALVANEPFPYK